MTGIVLAQLALTVLVYTRTGSPLLAALVFATGFFPHLIAGTLLSALVDRVPIRRLLVGCNVVSGAVALVMALPGTPIAALLVLAFVLGLIRPVFLGARAATLPDVLPGASYVPGRSLIRLVSQAAQVGGFAVSGILLTAVTPYLLLLGNAICFFVAAILLRIGTVERAPASDKAAQPSLLADSLAGIRTIMSVPALRRVMLFSWTVPALAVAPEALAIPYVDDISGGTVALGLLLTAIPLGTVLGEITTNWTVPAEWQVRTIGLLTSITFVPLLFFAFRPGVPLALTALFVSGLGAAAHLGLDRVLLDVAPVELRARALSVQAAGLMFGQGIAFAIAGAIAEFASAATIITVAGVAGLLVVAAYERESRRARHASV